MHALANAMLAASQSHNLWHKRAKTYQLTMLCVASEDYPGADAPGLLMHEGEGSRAGGGGVCISHHCIQQAHTVCVQGVAHAGCVAGRPRLLLAWMLLRWINVHPSRPCKTVAVPLHDSARGTMVAFYEHGTVCVCYAL